MRQTVSAMWLVALAATVHFTVCNQAHADQNIDRLLGAVTCYASFDQSLAADFGRGDLSLWTRYDHPSEPGKTTARNEADPKYVHIVPHAAAGAGSLHFRDVIPNNGFLFFRAGEKLAVKPGGWGGAASVWIQTDPERHLKTPHCDPLQIVHKRYFDGAIWCDFDSDKPRDLRLGMFPSLKPGEKGPPTIPESQQPIARAKDPPFAPERWHHLALVWDYVDAPAPAIAELYLDGKRIAKLDNEPVRMQWNLDQVRFFLGAALVGHLDEAALFSRSLSSSEVRLLAKHPALLAPLKGRGTQE